MSTILGIITIILLIAKILKLLTISWVLVFTPLAIGALIELVFSLVIANRFR